MEHWIKWTGDEAFDKQLSEDMDIYDIDSLYEQMRRGEFDDVAMYIPPDATDEQIYKVGRWLIADYHEFDEYVRDVWSDIKTPEIIVKCIEHDILMAGDIKSDLWNVPNVSYKYAEAMVKAAREIDKHQVRSGKFEMWDNNLSHFVLDLLAEKPMTKKTKRVLCDAIVDGVFMDYSN